MWRRARCRAGGWCRRAPPPARARRPSPRPVPPLRAEPWKAWNRWARAFSGTPGPSSPTSMVTRLPLRLRATRMWPLTGSCCSMACRALRHRLLKHAEQLVAIGIDAQRLVHLDRSRRWHPRAAGPVRRRPPSTSERSGHQLAAGRRLLGAAEPQRALGEVDGAVERGDQLRREALHGRVGQAAAAGPRCSCALASMLRRSWLILLTARPSAASRLFCCRVCVSSLLHVRQLALGGADLVLALRRHDDAAGVLRVLAEAQHVAGDAHHRLHQQAVEGEIDERRGDDRDDDRQAEDVEAVADHGGLQRRLRQHDLDEVARRPCRARRSRG